MEPDTLIDDLIASSRLPMSDAARVAACRTLFDYLACIAGAADNSVSWPAGKAGRLAVHAHLLDQDDLHLGTATHPGGVVWSAVIACGVAVDASLDEALAAAAVGYELMVRLADGLGAEHRSRWHSTATTGTVGAAGAAAELLSHSASTVGDAVGHALSVAGGSAQALAESTGTRVVHRAHAADAGVACATAAVAGLRGNRRGLEVGSGAFATQTPVELAAAVNGRRSQRAIEQAGFRLAPVTGWAHAAVGAAFSAGPVEPDTVAEVVVTLGPSIASQIASNPKPETRSEAWWSVEHAVAVVLARGNVGALADGLADRPDVLALCERVRLVDGGEGWGASVHVTLRTGDVIEAEQPGPHGHGESPASDDDLRHKWRRLAGDDDQGLLAGLLGADPGVGLIDALHDGLGHDPRLRALLLRRGPNGDQTQRDSASLG